MSKSSSSNVMDPSLKMGRVSSTGIIPSVAGSFNPTTDFAKSWISRVGNWNNAEKISLDSLFTEEFCVVGRVQSNFLYEGSSQFTNNYRLVLYGEHAEQFICLVRDVTSASRITRIPTHYTASVLVLDKSYVKSMWMVREEIGMCRI